MGTFIFVYLLLFCQSEKQRVLRRTRLKKKHVCPIFELKIFYFLQASFHVGWTIGSLNSVLWRNRQGTFLRYKRQETIKKCTFLPSTYKKNSALNALREIRNAVLNVKRPKLSTARRLLR